MKIIEEGYVNKRVVTVRDLFYNVGDISLYVRTYSMKAHQYFVETKTLVSNLNLCLWDSLTLLATALRSIQGLR